MPFYGQVSVAKRTNWTILREWIGGRQVHVWVIQRIILSFVTIPVIAEILFPEMAADSLACLIQTRSLSFC